MLSYYNGMTFNWENINRLSGIIWDDTTVSYEYDDTGIRTSKTVNGVKHTYTLEGSKIISESYGDVFIVYLYNENNEPIGMLYRKSSYEKAVFDEYYFTKNLQGDIIGIYDETGEILVEYYYDAWGCLYRQSNKSGYSYIAEANPFRYRGYYFDVESGFYYLNGRYYDPDVKRFINCDEFSILLTTPSALTDKNLYAYCDNNPVSISDKDGAFWHLIVGAVAGVVSQYISDVVSNLASGQSFIESLKPSSSIVEYISAGTTGALAMTGIGKVGAKIVNSAIETTAYIVDSAINGEEINGFSLILKAGSAIATSGEGLNLKHLKGVYNKSKQVLNAAISAKKIAQYTAKITAVKTKIKTAISENVRDCVQSGIIDGIKKRIG